MSQIHRAFTKWDGTNGVETPEAGTERAIRPSSLHQYSHDESNRHARENPDLSHSFESAQPVSPAPGAGDIPIRRPVPGDATKVDARLVTGVSSSVSLEQYRRLAAALLEKQVQKQLKTVVITSAVPREGKTLTAVNLGLTLSESYGRRVLVIDADLRWPSLHSALGIENHVGLSEALRGDQHELQFVEVSRGLSALTAGTPAPTPLAGLTSKSMAEVIDACAARFDWVLIDTSPVGVLPDAQVLARLVGAVIFVIGAGSTPAAVVERAIAELGPELILGTVLNRVEERRVPQAGYYGPMAHRDDSK